MTRSRFLDFDGSPAAAFIAQEDALEYLISLGYGNGDLAQARQALTQSHRAPFTFAPFGVRYCDFCLIQLMGGEYELLKDGRERCSRCSRTVISSSEEFVDDFNEVRRNMEAAFGVSLAVPLRVQMVNAKEIADRTNEKFVPTPGADPRVLGFASFKNGAYSLYLENGSPRMPAIFTMAHELTHIWQFKNWDRASIIARYGPHAELPVSEGMACWASVQYLLFVREYSHAERQFAYLMQRDDEYGVGFRAFLGRYPLRDDGDVGADTPFLNALPL